VRVRRSSRHTQLGTVLPLFPGTDRPCHTPLPRPFLQISPLAAPSSRTRSPSPFTLSGSAANTAQRPKLADACVSHRIRRQKLPLQEMFQARLGTRTERPASHQTLYGHCVEIGYNVIRTTSERPDHSMRRAGFQVALECVSLWSTDPIFVRTSYIADEKTSRCFVLSNPQRTFRAPEILCGDGSRGPSRCCTPASRLVGKASLQSSDISEPLHFSSGHRNARIGRPPSITLHRRSAAQDGMPISAAFNLSLCRFCREDQRIFMRRCCLSALCSRCR
jgi:hypothetical protein